ncbi:chemotaxis response regulator protein-glutamate methylesterase of group 2 operon [Clostridia bacterium]|nr:chemotaxis response regulator protein-glutamate methylesterase of group 2 operon [Clostridia bacterium]
MARKIRVLIVDDSMMFRNTISAALSVDSDFEVVGMAADPFEAKDRITELHPDVITLDVEMPKMNGIEFLKRLLPQYPIAAVVVTSSAVKAFDAISVGAVDLLNKPTRGGMPEFAEQLRAMVKSAATAKVIVPKNAAVPAVAASPAVAAKPAVHEKPPATSPKPIVSRISDKPIDMVKNAHTLIALGASTGGTEALAEVLTVLPADMPGIVVVQHMPAGFTKMYADRLNRQCKMSAKEAEDGDRVKQGQIIIGAGDFHLRVEKDLRGYYVTCRRGEKISGHCPSVDAMFESVAKSCGANAIGAILTGMGADGAQGLLQLRKAGGYTFGQDKESCVVYGMPMVAFNNGAVCKQLPLQSIAAAIVDRLR